MDVQTVKFNEIINITAHEFQTRETAELFAALAAFHQQLSKVSVTKDEQKEISLRNGGKRVLNYASLDNIIKVTRPLLAAQGLTVIQNLTGEFLSTRITHKSGQFLGYLTPFAPMAGNGTNEAQNIGGGLTYFRRYTYNAILNISIEDDNDGDNGRKLPELPEKEYQKAAIYFLQNANLNGVREKYNVSDKQAAAVFELAKDIFNKQKEAQEAAKKQAEEEGPKIEEAQRKAAAKTQKKKPATTK